MKIDIREAKTNLYNLVEQALAGEEVVLTKDGEALVRLEPTTTDTTATTGTETRPLGLHKARLSDEEAEEAMRAFFGDEELR